MKQNQKIMLLVSRVLIGWLFFYAGITKVLNPEWSAKGYLMGAKTFASFYQWLASPANIGWVNFLNEWGLTLIGLSLILGIWVRWSALAGAIMMILYWFPDLSFPYVGHGFIVDEHIVYASTLLLLKKFNAGAHFGVDALLKK